MIKRFDEVLGKEEWIHEEVPADKGVELKLTEPETFRKIFEEVEEDD